MIRIGIDARLIKEKKSGLVTYVLNLIQSLSKDPNYNVFIFYNSRYTDVFSSFTKNKKVYLIPTYYSGLFLNMSDFFYEQTVFPFLINRYNLDIFHNPFGFGIPYFIKTKALLTIHDIIPLFQYDNLFFLQRLVYRISLAISIKKAQDIVCITHFTKQEILRAFKIPDSKKITVIHNGFDNLTKRAVSKDETTGLFNKYKLHKKYILYVGSGTKRKNLPRLVEAFLLLKKQFNIEHTFILVSKFDRFETKKTYDVIYKQISRYDLKDAVFFTGHVSNDQKSVLLKNCDIFVYSSLYEGFGLPILEAMAFKKAVICSDIAPFHEVAGEAACFFDPYSVKSIPGSILKVITDKAYKNKLEEEGIRQSKQFSWEKMANEYRSVYEKICNN